MPTFTGGITITAHPLVGSEPGLTQGGIVLSRRPTASAQGTAPAVFSGGVVVSSHPLVQTTPTFTGSCIVTSHPVVGTPATCTGGVAVNARTTLSAAGYTSTPIFTGGVTVVNHPKSFALFGGNTPFVATGGVTVPIRRTVSSGGVIVPDVAGGVAVSTRRQIAAIGFSQAVPAFHGSTTVRRRPYVTAGGRNVYRRYAVRFVVNMVSYDEADLDFVIAMDDVGLQFQVQVVDENGLPMDVSQADLMLYQFLKPKSLAAIVKTASLLNDGRDGLLVYEFQQGDLDVKGTWRFQLVLGWDDSVKHSEIQRFRVIKNLPTGA